MKSAAEKLLAHLQSYGRLAIAFSGGVDSTLLAEAARRALGADNVLLLHAASELLVSGDRYYAADYPRRTGLAVTTVELMPLELPEVRENGPRRCYFCKKFIFTRLIEVAAGHGYAVIADGTNRDDLDDYRPGLEAADELGVRHPLLECGLTKAAVRQLARDWNLVNAELPASACLASRVPTGRELNSELLHRIGAGEDLLIALGLPGVRLRVLDNLAKIELPLPELPWALARREAIVSGLKKLGFDAVALDLEGYRRGAMNRK